jgi:hypothetical protein
MLLNSSMWETFNTLLDNVVFNVSKLFPVSFIVWQAVAKIYYLNFSQQHGTGYNNRLYVYVMAFDAKLYWLAYRGYEDCKFVVYCDCCINSTYKFGYEYLLTVLWTKLFLYMIVFLVH